MKLSPQAQDIYTLITAGANKMGELKKIASGIKTNHALAMELWTTKAFLPRLLSVLIMDKKQFNQELMDSLVNQLQIHSTQEQNQVMEWLMANQLSKDKQGIAMMLSWEHSQYSLQRRTF
jgi:formate dehydrogenase maturation protein FdhE